MVNNSKMKNFWRLVWFRALALELFQQFTVLHRMRFIAPLAMLAVSVSWWQEQRIADADEQQRAAPIIKSATCSVVIENVNRERVGKKYWAFVLHPRDASRLRYMREFWKFEMSLEPRFWSLNTCQMLHVHKWIVHFPGEDDQISSTPQLFPNFIWALLSGDPRVPLWARWICEGHRISLEHSHVFLPFVDGF